MAKKVFLTAEWRKLVMVNYAVDPELLKRYVPPGTELDFWQNRCYISLVGFMFRDVRLFGISIPFHRNFEEVNLRFYVRHNYKGDWRRGVVFIREFVPLPMVSFMANVSYGERYQTLRMKHAVSATARSLQVRYDWKKQSWHSLTVEALNEPKLIRSGSKEEFITQHFWGYAKKRQNGIEYEVGHELWKTYPVQSFDILVNYGSCYGEEFGFLDQLMPDSVFLVEGSPIDIYAKRRIIQPGSMYAPA